MPVVLDNTSSFESVLEMIGSGLQYEWDHLGEMVDYAPLRAKGLIVPSLSDLGTLAALVVGGGIVLYLLQFVLLPRLGRAMGLRPSQLSKFADSALQVLVFGSLLIVESLICFSEDWALALDFFPTHNYPYGITTSMSWLYLTQIAWYTYGLLVLLLSRAARKKDLAAFVAHHFITLFLVGGSYIMANSRIGLVVFALHDPADVFLQSAKLLRYFGFKKACDATFILFVVVWVVTRCVLFPITAHAVWTGVFTQMAAGVMTATTFLQTLALYCLIGLHMYWTYLIMRMAYRFVVVKEVEKDIRSDSDEEESSSSSSAKKSKKGSKKD